MFLPYLDVLCVISGQMESVFVLYIIMILVILDKIRNVFKKIRFIHCVRLRGQIWSLLHHSNSHHN